MLVNPANDPPGQRSTYINPGDVRTESYRLSTFSASRFNSQFSRLGARNGFFYTGFRDRVKCFSCGQNVEQLRGTEDLSNPGWHKHNCLMPRGGDPDNIPFYRTSTPAASSAPSVHMNISIQHPPAATAQPAAMPRVAPATNQSVSITVQHNTLSALEQVFPCHEPINPHMRREASRIQTFRDQMNMWSSNNITASPERMAAAGLFYIGQTDRVKCWYCNGGLQNWLPNDNPWFEHAKWFPTCEYVLQQRGPEYVHNVCMQFPNLRRPESPRRNLPSVVSGPSHQMPGRGLMYQQSPQIIDPREETRRRKAKIDREMIASPLVNQARQLGFSDNQIRSAFTKSFEVSDKTCEDMDELLDIIMNLPNDDPVQVRDLNGRTTSYQSSSIASLSRAEEIRAIEESKICKVCRNANACIVLLPCGHLSVCQGCSINIERCPICRTFTREKLLTYLV
ncbi:baculoviral IAP repeat-containing protein 7-A [Ciona intestinalis]